MKQFVYEYHKIDDFRTFLNTEVLFSKAKRDSVSSLIQIFTPPKSPDIRKITDELILLIPDAVIIGASSVGEIANGTVYSFSTVIIFSFFADTHLAPFSMVCQKGKERSVGESLSRVITTGSDIKGILLLTTPMSLNASELLTGLKQQLNGHLIFGGGASEYSADEPGWVLHHKRFLHSGIVAVTFSSKSLQISAGIGSGWRPFGTTKKITDTDGLSVISIDNEPAINVLQQYTGTIDNTLFSENASIFALMLERENQLISRIPMTKDQFGAIQFAADVHQDETFRLGVGDPALMIESSQNIANKQVAFQPEAIFIFACSIRRMLLQMDAAIETQLFNHIASSGGFYTSGEIFFDPNDQYLALLYNTCMLAVGLRENTSADELEFLPMHEKESSLVTLPNNQYEQRHAKVIANLMQFIRAITDELESTNEKLLTLSITDKLTGIFNRVELDNVLAKEIDRSRRYNISLSVIILDIDNFKSINDNYGHIVGDSVLVDVAKILKNSVRTSDTVGRWGGEEFMIILPHTNAHSSYALAEKIRTHMQSHEFNMVGHQTASFGVACYKTTDDDILSFIDKADSALYRAKSTGKNKVVISPRDIDQTNDSGFLHLDWKPEYECHNEIINAQHKHLFSAGNAIIKALLNKQSDEQLKQQIDGLILELKHHFESEEKIFEKTTYPYILEHKKNHLALITKANQLNDGFKMNKVSIGDLLEFVIHDTISEHLIKADQGFFEYLIEER